MKTKWTVGPLFVAGLCALVLRQSHEPVLAVFWGVCVA